MAKNLSPGLLTVALTLLVVFLFMNCGAKRSTYVLEPRPVMIKAPQQSAQSIFDLKYDLSCVPGPTKAGSYYTKDLTPGGICGAQEWVAQQAEGYTITDGIGGSLMDR
jgi:hypothetical protein